MAAISSGMPLGASHGIGHQLDRFGVGLSGTSCLLFPTEYKFNASHRTNQSFRAGTLQEYLASRRTRERDLATREDAKT